MAKFYLHNFCSVKGTYKIDQKRASDNLVNMRCLLNEELKGQEKMVSEKINHYGMAGYKINQRYSEIADYILDLPKDEEKLTFFKNRVIPKLEERMEFYKEKALNVLNRFYPESALLPNHLVHVSCTGLTSPSAPQILASKKTELNSLNNTTVTQIYQMGCYASFPAMRVARGFAYNPTQSIDIVHNEMCSLHFDPTTLDPGQIIVQGLFGDGHIKYTMTGDKPEHNSLEVLALHERIIPDSIDSMSWTPGSENFLMTLAKDVPQKIGPYLETYMTELLSLANLEAHDDFVFAIHPGGPRIIESVEAAFGLDPAMTIESHEIFHEYGNISSATIPHILQRILDNPNRKDGTEIIAVAFGPGLTISGGVFRICR